MTEKLPAQSSRALISAASRSPASSGFGIGIRSNTTPQVRGSGLEEFLHPREERRM